MGKAVSGKREIGKAIKRILLNRGITQNELAEKIGVSKQVVSYMINRKEDKYWLASEINTVSNVLKIDASVLLKYVVSGAEC